MHAWIFCVRHQCWWDRASRRMVSLLTLQRGETQAATRATKDRSKPHDIATLMSLKMHIQEIIEMSEAVESAADVDERREATAVCPKRAREQGVAAAVVHGRLTSAASSTVVLTNDELLVHILGYLGGGKGWHFHRRKTLGRMALVCRTWRDAAHHESLWRPLAKEVKLVVEDRETTAQQLEAARGSYRRYLMDCGQSTLQRRVLNGWRWVEDLTMQCEVWDEDDFCIFSGETPIELDAHGNEWQIDVFGYGPAFSVASRPRRYGADDARSMRKLFSGGDRLHVRITVYDMRTRRSAVLWAQDNHGVDKVEVTTAGRLTITSETVALTSVAIGNHCIDTRVGLTMGRVSGDVGGIPRNERLWEVESAFIGFATEGMQLGRFIWSVLT